MPGGVSAEARAPRRRIAAAEIVAVLVVAALVGVCIGAGSHFLLAQRPPTATPNVVLRGGATWAAGVRPAPAITSLHDQSGRLFSLSSLRGRTVAMVFFDSHCTQACPLAGRALAAAERPLPAAQRPVLVAVSINPLDTPASARSAVRKWGLAQVGGWHWLLGSHAQLAPVWKAYHIFVAPPRGGDISHTEALYLIDRGGNERSGYLYPYAPRLVKLDLRTLANDRQG